MPGPQMRKFDIEHRDDAGAVVVSRVEIDVVAFAHGLSTLPHQTGTTEWLTAMREAVGKPLTLNGAINLMAAIGDAVDDVEREQRWMVDLAYDLRINPWALEPWQAILLHAAKTRRARESVAAADREVLTNHTGYPLSMWYDSAVRQFGEDKALDLLETPAMAERVRVEGAPPQLRGARDPKTEAVAQ